MSKKLINYKEVSRQLAGNEESIRKNKVPKKYQEDVTRLEKSVDDWEKSIVSNYFKQRKENELQSNSKKQ